MRVLVTGATGFIGRHVTARLVDADHQAYALVRDPVRAKRHLPANVRWHVVDLTEPDLLEDILDNIDAVIHLAAATVGDWPTQLQATVEGTAALLDACRTANVYRFIHVSSVAVYDTRSLADGHTLAPNARLAEPSPDLGPYARAKLEAEHRARTAADAGHIDLTILRPGLVYGPRRVLFEHLGKPLPRLNRRLAYGSPDQRLPFVHVDSVADALLRTLTSPSTIGQTYNIVDEHDCSRQAYLNLHQQLTGRRQRTTYLPAGPLARLCDLSSRLPLPGGKLSGDKIRTRALSLHYTTDTLTRDTGWTPPHTLHVALADAIETTPGPHGRPLRVAVVGAGLNARYHLAPLHAHPHVRLVGLVDQQPDRAATLAKTFNITLATDSLDELFEHDRPDLVHLVTPPQTHASLTCELLQRGADVFCEKPMAMTRGECQLMARVATEHRRSLAVNHNLWFDPRLAATRQLVASGAIGDVVHIETHRAFAPRGMAAQPATRAAWLGSLPGGLLEDITPHALYATLGLLRADAKLLYAHHWCTDRHASDTAVSDELRLTLSDGHATAHIAISLNARPDTFTLRVHGTLATLIVDVQNMLLLLQRPGQGPRVLDRANQLARVSLGSLAQSAVNAARLATKRTQPPGDMTSVIHEHIRCLIEDHPFPISPEAGEHVVSLIEQIWPRHTPALAARPAALHERDVTT
ncbi:NAD-dependent epimerase/dehydratase family protein [Phycisphaerales bacterium AB-hyl4]|uniref:NAD-dependent epimerase/dehydratase family protein n=1 Tax=Natronomicrosphaera hydrolytica TaxID=3242702 RepID=A0ABV4U177_9BACT